MAGGILSGLGQVLQYALPAAAGFALGGPLGAAAGVGMGAQDIQQQKIASQEMQDREAETALRWQQFGLEKQQAQMAMQSEQSWNDYASSLSPEDKAMALKDPSAYITQHMQDRQWDLTKDTLKNHPEFAESMGLDPKAISSITAMPSSIGQPLLDKYIAAKQTGKFPNGVHVMTNADGTTSLIGVGAGGETTTIAQGVAPKTLPSGGGKGGDGGDKPVKIPSPASLAVLATKVANDAIANTPGVLGTHYGASTKAREANAMVDFVGKLTASGVDPDKAQELAEKYVKPKFEAANAKPSASDKLKAAAKPKAAPTPTAIPAGAKPVYDPSGKLVGYTHD